MRLALCRGKPSALVLNEPKGRGYARAQIGPMATEYGSAYTRCVNTTAITFPRATGSWGTITHAVFVPDAVEEPPRCEILEIMTQVAMEVCIFLIDPGILVRRGQAPSFAPRALALQVDEDLMFSLHHLRFALGVTSTAVYRGVQP